MKNLVAGALAALAMQVSAAAAVDQPIFLDAAHGRIAGSLMLPASSEKKTLVVLIISGSGATDRDGNIASVRGKNDALKMLAATLADAGFASVRYDKRGVGASAAAVSREADLRLGNYVEDAAAWIGLLAADARFSGVAVVGHSEGSLIGMLAAKERPISAFVSIAGVAQGAAAILREQLTSRLPVDLVERNNAILASLEKGEEVGDIPAPLAAFYRPSVQPYLISWFKHVPALEIKQVRVPCLILQGDTDIQVPVAEAMALGAAKPEAELRIIPGMNHVLKQVPMDPARQMASYGDPALPIAPGLGESLVRFLSAHQPRP